MRSIRMRSDPFDPVRGIPHEGTSTENLQAFLREVHEHKNALALPHQAPALGQPFRAFKFLRGYQRRILKVDCERASDRRALFVSRHANQGPEHNASLCSTEQHGHVFVETRVAYE